MKLTDVQVRQVKFTGKQKKHADGRGLYLLVTRTAKLWRFDYRYGDKRKTLALGVYPDVTLVMARERLQGARTLLAEGIDPMEVKRQRKAAQDAITAGTVEALGCKWLALHRPAWSGTHYIRERRNLEKDVFPWLGARAIGGVEPPELLEVIRKVEARGALDTAHRVLITARGVWQFAIAEGYAQRDITQDIKKALRPHLRRNMPAITDPDEFAVLLRACDAYQGGAVVRAALAVAPILFQRPGNLRRMRWADLDLPAALWVIPSADMKRTKAQKINGAPHVVPLPRQVLAILQELHPVTGRHEWVFPGHRDRSRPLGEASIAAALNGMGYRGRQTWHGFRASGRTLIRERLGVDADVIEAQLAHTGQIAHGGAYDRAQFVDERAVMLQAWADYLDRLRGNDTTQGGRSA